MINKIKDTNKIIIWSLCVILLCFLTGCLFVLGGASATQVPGAVIKVEVPQNWTLVQTFEQIDEILLEHDYIKQPYDERLSSQSYLKENFEFHYDPYDPPQEELRVLYLHFKESSGRLFSEAGIQEYAEITEELAIVRLESMPEDEADREHSRWAATPEMFNERQQSFPMLIPLVTGPLLIVVSLSFYGVLILWPGFWIASKILNHFTIPDTLKRILFIVSCSLLAPGLILLTPFGPPFLVPFPLALLFALAAPPLLILLLILLICTVILALLVSFRIWRLGSSSS